jgi:hypothetical protein
MLIYELKVFKKIIANEKATSLTWCGFIF